MKALIFFESSIFKNYLSPIRDNQYQNTVAVTYGGLEGFSSIPNRSIIVQKITRNENKLSKLRLGVTSSALAVLHSQI